MGGKDIHGHIVAQAAGKLQARKSKKRPRGRLSNNVNVHRIYPDPDPGAAKRAFDAIMQIKKIDITTIEAARRGSGVCKECLNEDFDSCDALNLKNNQRRTLKSCLVEGNVYFKT